MEQKKVIVVPYLFVEKEYWSDGVLECWSDGVLEYWSDGVLE